MKRLAFVVGVSLLMAAVSMVLNYGVVQAVNWNSGGG
jgi:hypothetical protein